VPDVATLVVLYHLSFNIIVASIFIGFTQVVAGWVNRLLPKPERTTVAGRQRHLDPTALATPSLAISCAVREAMHQADVVESMLTGMFRVIKNNDRKLSEDLRKMDDTVDELYSEHQVLPDQDLARGPERERRPALDRHHQLHDQHGADRRHRRARADRHRGQEDQHRARVLRGRHRRDQRPALPAGGQPAPGHERVPARQCARRAEAARGKDPLSATWSANTPPPTWGGWR
jgi:hypothetical protein